MSDTIREFLVQGSEPSPYKVVFKRNGTNLKATCSCRAGVIGIVCKHRLAILDDNSGDVVSENIDQVAEVAAWAVGSSVGEAISELASLEADKKSIENKIRRAKKLVAKALID